MFVSRVDTLLDELSRRRRERVTKADLARFLGVSRQAVSQMTHPRGTKTLNAETIAQMCLFFDLDADQYQELFELQFDTQQTKAITEDEDEDEQVAVAAG